MTGALKRKTATNIAYNATSKLTTFAFQAVASVILTRTLSAADYGVVGFAWIFINFLAQFNDLGINNAVIQARELDDDALFTAFTMKTLLAFLVCGAAAAAAPLAVRFLDNAAIVPVIRVLSLNFLIAAWGFVPTVLLLRDLDYRRLAISSTCATVASGCLAVVLALSGFGYWSIVTASIGAALVNTIMLNLIRGKRIHWRLSRIHAAHFIRYGWSLFVSGLVIFAIFNADSFVIGALAGSTVLGYYVIALSWGAMITTLAGAIVNSVLFPTLSRLQGDRERIRRGYLLSLEYITFTGILINLTLFFVAREFLHEILGHGTDKWLPSLTALRILCIYGVIRVMLEPLGNVIMALGRTKLLMVATLLCAVLELGMLYPALHYFGIEGAASVVTLAYAAQYAVYYPFLKKDIGITLRDIVDTVGPALSCAILIAPALFLYQYLRPDTTILSLFEKVFACAVGYAVIYGMVTRWKVFGDVRSIIGRSRPHETS
jgi:lipopolysaccharide exporter